MIIKRDLSALKADEDGLVNIILSDEEVVSIFKECKAKIAVDAAREALHRWPTESVMKATGCNDAAAFCDEVNKTAVALASAVLANWSEDVALSTTADAAVWNYMDAHGLT